MSRSGPWDGIPTPTAEFNVVRVPGTTGVPIYWGKDPAAQCMLILGLDGDFAIQFRRETISLHGIGVDLRQSDVAGQQRLVLTLARHVDSDLFLSLCDTLIDCLKPVGDSATALAVALAHLRRWKAFLAGRNARLLSPEEVRGLFGELHVLRKLYQSALSKAEAVDAWCGPEDSHQDFIFGNRSIEVKALSGRERRTVRISSEDQLESLADELFLMIQRLAEMPDSEHALSLNEMAALIEGELSDAETGDRFADKLASVGYAPLIEYDSPRFAVVGLQGYRVSPGFPRLVRSELPHGIVKVTYDIMLEAISSFACEDDEIFRRS